MKVVDGSVFHVTTRNQSRAFAWKIWDISLAASAKEIGQAFFLVVYLSRKGIFYLSEQRVYLRPFFV